MTTAQNTTKTMNIALWIAQGLLAMTFILGGLIKLFQPEQLPFPWMKDSKNLVLITGIADLVGGIGILAPSILRIQPKLTIYAAYAIIVLMTAAIVFHISRGESKDIGFTIFILLLAVFIAWGRQLKAPLTPKNN